MGSKNNAPFIKIAMPIFYELEALKAGISRNS